MENDDFVENLDGQLVIKADKNMWCQSHNMTLSEIIDLSLTFTTTTTVMLSKFLFHIKITIPDGYLIYEYKFNNSHSHTFRQSGGKILSNAYDTIASPRTLKPGENNVVRLNKEGQDWFLSINGFRYIRIKGIYKPTEMIMSLAYPAENITLDSSSIYLTDFIKFKSLFHTSSLNGNDFQPKYIKCYILNLNNNSTINLKIGKALDFDNIKTIADFNIRENKSTSNTNHESTTTVSSVNLSVKPDINANINTVLKPIEGNNTISQTFESQVNAQVKSVEDIEQTQSTRSKVKSIERSKLTVVEIEELFRKCCDHYLRKGFDEHQPELIIFQMGVSFCTSRNSIGDLVSHLIWERSDGKFVRIKKCDHVKLLNSLCKINCNIERVMLRHYSNRILTLLKAGLLTPAYHHANQRGIKSEFAYLVTDFFDYGKLKLSDQELQVLNSDMQYVLLKTKHRRSIVNVNQLY
uniref:Minor coat protein n=1 Tax=croton golden spot associated virus C TaxID=3072822 RepID=A0AA50E3I3_9CLOS|nr:minor coat protein [croton golden spot associated virus C]